MSTTRRLLTCCRGHGYERRYRRYQSCRPPPAPADFVAPLKQVDVQGDEQRLGLLERTLIRRMGSTMVLRLWTSLVFNEITNSTIPIY